MLAKRAQMEWDGKTVCVRKHSVSPDVTGNSFQPRPAMRRERGLLGNLNET